MRESEHPKHVCVCVFANKLHRDFFNMQIVKWTMWFQRTLVASEKNCLQLGGELEVIKFL